MSLNKLNVNGSVSVASPSSPAPGPWKTISVPPEAVDASMKLYLSMARFELGAAGVTVKLKLPAAATPKTVTVTGPLVAAFGGRGPAPLPHQ